MDELDDDALLKAALEAWRKTPARELRDAITRFGVVDGRYTKDRNIRGWHVILTPEGSATIRTTGRSPDVDDLGCLVEAAIAHGLSVAVEAPKKFIASPPKLSGPEIVWRVASK